MAIMSHRRSTTTDVIPMSLDSGLRPLAHGYATNRRGRCHLRVTSCRLCSCLSGRSVSPVSPLSDVPPFSFFLPHFPARSFQKDRSTGDTPRNNAASQPVRLGPQPGTQYTKPGTQAPACSADLQTPRCLWPRLRVRVPVVSPLCPQFELDERADYSSGLCGWYSLSASMPMPCQDLTRCSRDPVLARRMLGAICSRRALNRC